MELKELSLKQIVSKIKLKEISQKEVYNYFLNRIENLDPKLEAFNFVNNIFEEKDTNLPLAGIPVGVKDLFCEKGIKTTASSKMLADFIPPYDSTIIKNLKNAGFSSIGKTNLDEYAMGGSGENSAFRITKNPWDISRIPGGSSSGSAASVASGMVPASLGTDTGGSIRQPASMCGIVGFKPTYGRNSRWGIVAMASSLDTPGTFTKTVEDAGFLYEIMAGYDKLDSTSINKNPRLDPNIWNKENLKGIKLGIPKEYFKDGIDSGVNEEIQKAIKCLEKLGAEIIDISLPHTEYGLAVYYIIMPAEVSTNLARYDGIRFGHANDDGLDIINAFKKNRSEGFGKEAQRRIMLGSFVLSSGFYDAYYKKASMVRELIKKDFDEAFKKVDIIITPTAPSVAWKIGEKVNDPLKMYLSDIFTVNGSLAQLPGLSLPVGYAKPEDGGNIDLPVGLQILGPKLGEEKIFEVANILEKSLKDYVESKKPEIF